MFPQALAKLLPSFWRGSGIAFNSRIQSGRAGSFIVCRCGPSWSRRNSKSENGCFGLHVGTQSLVMDQTSDGLPFIRPWS
jgi:hypothetical protein